MHDKIIRQWRDAEGILHTEYETAKPRPSELAASRGGRLYFKSLATQIVGAQAVAGAMIPILKGKHLN